MSEDDRVFKALADPTRRFLLDLLFTREGRTLTELESEVEMTRFGVAKHLKVLEEAGLVVVRRSGREKLHFLNTVPIRQIHDRWIDKYAAPVASMLTGLKKRLEEDQMEKVYEIYIKTTPERLWHATTDPALRAKYSFGLAVESDWNAGSRYVARTTAVNPEAGIELADGENIEVDPPRRLVQTYRAQWSDAVKAEGYSRVTWEIKPVGDSCCLTVTHDRLRAHASPELYGGWPMILSGLKTLLETGETLTTPGSQMFVVAAS
jgi:uncharacterized protein YndB with AHSA1/START domain/DNA-binding transcriptional ArsR family regulator